MKRHETGIGAGTTRKTGNGIATETVTVTEKVTMRDGVPGAGRKTKIAMIESQIARTELETGMTIESETGIATDAKEIGIGIGTGIAIETGMMKGADQAVATRTTTRKMIVPVTGRAGSVLRMTTNPWICTHLTIGYVFMMMPHTPVFYILKHCLQSRRASIHLIGIH